MKDIQKRMKAEIERAEKLKQHLDRAKQLFEAGKVVEADVELRKAERLK